MNALGSYLDRRDNQRSAQENQAKRDGIAQETDAQRLLRFDAWVKGELDKRLDWAWAGDQRVKRIEQCRVQIEGLVLELWRRGWMLDGKKLAERITAAIDNVASAQKKGGVLDFWAYFKSVISRYVGANAEEIQYEARNVGALLSQTLSALGVKSHAPAATPLPQLIAQRREEIVQAKTLREQQTAERKKQKAAAKDETLPLL